jgi:hypothetical protein
MYAKAARRCFTARCPVLNSSVFAARLCQYHAIISDDWQATRD